MDIGILLWNTCNAKCSHCAVSSGPEEKPVLTNEQIFRVIDSAFYDCSSPSIGLSGGEAFVYFDRLCEVIAYAVNKGARVSINTNCFWAKSVQEAKDIISIIKALGVTKIVASTDQFHQEYIVEARVINAVRACVDLHLEIDVQYVSSRTSKRLHDFLSLHGDELVNIAMREIPIHPVGRASQINSQELFLKDRIPTGLCPSAIPSISASGDIIPCCNTAGHLSSLRIGSINECLPAAFEKFKSNPLMFVLRQMGPSVLLEIATKYGYSNSRRGYLDQCHLCYELFRNEEVAEKLRKHANILFEQALYDDYLQQYIEHSSASRNLHVKTCVA